MNPTLNDKPAVKIKAVKKFETSTAVLLDCEGDEIWFPKKYVKYNKDEKTLLIEEWLYDSKVEEGML